MKKKVLTVLILISTLLFNYSCSLEDFDPEINFSIDVIAIESVDIDQEFILGQTHEIIMTYLAPTDCYEFNDFIYDVSGNQRTIAIVNTVYVRDNCEQINEMVEVSLNIEITSTETYVFRFFQGKDEQGNDQYHIVEVPVIE